MFPEGHGWDLFKAQMWSERETVCRDKLWWFWTHCHSRRSTMSGRKKQDEEEEDEKKRADARTIAGRNKMGDRDA